MNQRSSFLEPSERQESWRKILPCAFLLSVIAALYYPSLHFGFVWDDFFYITTNYRIHGLSGPQLRTVWSSAFMGHYAPVQQTFLALIYRLEGLRPFGYHLGQLLIHAACVGLLYFILKRIESPRIALLATLWFAVHPANVETVAWVSETKSTLAFLFFLLSFWAFIQLRAKEQWRYLILCCLFLVLSVLSKINTVIAPAIFLLYDYWQGDWFQWKKLWSVACVGLISAIFVVVHLISFHGSAAGMESSYYGGLGVHVQNLPFLLFFYLRMTIFPNPLSAWHMFPVYERFTLPVAAAWIALLGAAWLLLRANRRVQFWALWFLMFLAPVLQIIPFAIWVADRYLYIPAIGLFVLIGGWFFQVLDRLREPWQRWGWELGMGACMLLLAMRVHGYLPIWKSDLVLWETTEKTCPTSPYCHNNLGEALMQAGQTERGIHELIRAVEIRPDPRYLVTLGDAFLYGIGDYHQALNAYNMALERGVAGLGAKFYAKLARAYLLGGDMDQAGRAIQAGGEVDGNEPTLLVINGFYQWKRGNLEWARASLQRSLIITGQGSNAHEFFLNSWGNAGEVNQLLADLRSSKAIVNAGKSQ